MNLRRQPPRPRHQRPLPGYPSRLGIGTIVLVGACAALTPSCGGDGYMMDSYVGGDVGSSGGGGSGGTGIGGAGGEGGQAGGPLGGEGGGGEGGDGQGGDGQGGGAQGGSGQGSG